ncbi:receptor-transporting protein 2-like isoform X1 [Cyanistes caeruleus]|uniref:receptor-transporting protein 2-like isoform X1 n=2 Tax=Cyanistes caeruleus TaxID=156563 RepID=UPI000CDAE837|nr:receptor-transporting protein 2-like isoform X1 [Cyanistes caeruleus]
MTTWQGIFAVKIEEMHITDPWTLVEDDFLQVQDCRPGWKEFVQNRALGRFECSQCFHKWSSAKVHILFHMCHSQGWGTVWMRIFRQKCRRCPNSRLEDPEFSLETVETILHNLAIKILQYFYNKPVQPSDLLEVVVDTLVTGPHDRAHCEACQLGNCNRSQRAPAQDAWKPLRDEDKARMYSTESWLALASDVWKSLTNMGEARTHHTESWPSPGSDDCKPLIGVGKARTHRTESWPSPGSDDCKPFVGVGKARTHRTESQSAREWAAWNADVSRTSQPLKRQDLRPHVASTHHPSPSNSNFPWKCCCCIGGSLLCVLALIIFVVLYFTLR